MLVSTASTVTFVACKVRVSPLQRQAGLSSERASGPQNLRAGTFDSPVSTVVTALLTKLSSEDRKLPRAPTRQQAASRRPPRRRAIPAARGAAAPVSRRARHPLLLRPGITPPTGPGAAGRRPGGSKGGRGRRAGRKLASAALAATRGARGSGSSGFRVGATYAYSASRVVAPQRLAPSTCNTLLHYWLVLL